MNFIHYTKAFEKNVDESRLPAIKKKIEDLRNIDKPETLNSFDSYTKGILALKFYGAFMCRVLIQSEWLEIKGQRVRVFFVRDYISKKGFDYFWGSVTHPQLTSGDWLSMNPLPVEEVNRFKSDYEKAFSVTKNNKLPLPSELTEWLKDFKIHLNFDVYEREDWVLFSNDRTQGLLEKHILLFRTTIKGILDNKERSKVKIDLIDEKRNIYTAIYEPFNTGVIFGEYNDQGVRKIVLYDGAHLKEQAPRWEAALSKIKADEDASSNTVLNISKDAFRAYPKWIVTNDTEDLWNAIQRYEGSHNLSLLPEQVNFLNTFKFPAYINGQAGSGKSTMLYYLFANVFFYKCAEQNVGDIIFLTENDNLLEHTCKSIIGLLSNNPEFNVGLTIEERNAIRNHFSSFRNYLLGILPEELQTNYPADKYLDFAKFKDKFNARYSTKKHSAEEVWFVISTYVYGYYEDQNIDSVAKYVDENNGIPSKFRIVSSDNFGQIVKSYLPFYDKLIEDGWWDKITIVRKIREFYPGPLPKQYSVVFCDEAQDFSRIELRLIIQSSEFTKYDLSKTDQVPIVFAGDALQTVSPTGFSDTRLHQMYYDAFEVSNFEYDKVRSTYNPEYNYRSLQPIVRLANLVQNFRKECLKEDVVIKQYAKRDKVKAQVPMVHTTEWLSKAENRKIFEEKFKYKSFIVPVDLNEETEYVKNQELLNGKFTDIKSSIDAKGAEYSQVVVYGFGDYYIKEFGNLDWKVGEFDFKRKFFFNKLYVAITRAQNELIVIDSSNAAEHFWKKLLSIPKEAKRWEEFNDINDILPINPGTGLTNIQDSTPDEALSNAIMDMEQGIMDKNIARLIVASSVFLMLGKVEEANNCQGYKDSIKKNWSSAGSHFIKAKNLEEAANAFFQGKIWGELFNSPTKSLSGYKQEIRILIGNLMQNKNWDRKELSKVYELRQTLGEVIHDIDWSDELKSNIIEFTKASTSQELKRELAYIIEAIAKENDVELWDALGELYFETKQFNYAIQSWGRILNRENLPHYNAKYILANIEKAKDESNQLDEILWTGRFLTVSSDTNSKKGFAKAVLSSLSSKAVEVKTSEIKFQLFEAGLTAACILDNLDAALQYSMLMEENNSDHVTLHQIYSKCLQITLRLDLSIYLKERWARSKYFELTGLETAADIVLTKLNAEFSSLKFPFPDTNQPWELNELQNIPEKPKPISNEPQSHIRDFVLQGFRRFENIEIKNLSQFNLILGDNNSGKTTILESLLFDTDPTQCLANLIYARRQRNNNSAKERDYNFLESIKNSNRKESDIRFLFKEGRRIWNYRIKHPSVKQLFDKIGIDKLDPKTYLAVENSLNELSISDSIEEISNRLLDANFLNTIPYVPFGKGYTDRLSSIYHSEIGSKRAVRSEFISQMKTFIPNIVEITIDPQTDSIKIEEEIDGKDRVFSLNDYGEGANKLFRIMVQLHAAKNKRLMIDELDAGIHFSRFEKFWKVILKAANEYNVQLFVTTHNEECIKYFWQVLQDDEFKNCREKSRTVTLETHVKTGEILAIVRDYDSMLYSNQHDLEIRGGGI